jgi:hypothetical protein
MKPYLEKPFTKKMGVTEANGVDQCVSPEFKPQYRKKQKVISLKIVNYSEFFLTSYNAHNLYVAETNQTG